MDNSGIRDRAKIIVEQGNVTAAMHIKILKFNPTVVRGAISYGFNVVKDLDVFDGKADAGRSADFFQAIVIHGGKFGKAGCRSHKDKQCDNHRIKEPLFFYIRHICPYGMCCHIIKCLPYYEAFCNITKCVAYSAIVNPHCPYEMFCQIAGRRFIRRPLKDAIAIPRSGIRRWAWRSVRVAKSGISMAFILS